MKIPRTRVLVLLVVVGSAAAFGDSVTDPTIIIRGASGSAPRPFPAPKPGYNAGPGIFSRGVRVWDSTRTTTAHITIR